MGGHIHIHHAHIQPCIQNTLNSFLISPKTSSSINLTLTKISSYIEFHSNTAHILLKDAIKEFSQKNIHKVVIFLEKVTTELIFKEKYLEEVYSITHLPDKNAINCIPLCLYVVNEISQFLSEQHCKNLYN